MAYSHENPIREGLSKTQKIDVLKKGISSIFINCRNLQAKNNTARLCTK